MTIHPIRAARRGLARVVLRLVRRWPHAHVRLVRCAWRIAPTGSPERARSTRALVVIVGAWRMIDQRAEDAHAIAATKDLPQVLRAAAALIEQAHRRSGR